MKKCLKNFGAELKKNRALFMMILPAAIIIIIFSYLPMSGLVLAFKDYRYNLGVFGSEWNGLENFRFLFESGTGWLITKSTILYNLLNLVTSQGLAILIAVAITEMKVIPFKKVTQSVIFFPYFISWVIVCLLYTSILSLGIRNGYELEIQCEGRDEKEALGALLRVIRESEEKEGNQPPLL